MPRFGMTIHKGFQTAPLPSFLCRASYSSSLAWRQNATKRKAAGTDAGGGDFVRLESHFCFGGVFFAGGIGILPSLSMYFLGP